MDIPSTLDIGEMVPGVLGLLTSPLSFSLSVLQLRLNVVKSVIVRGRVRHSPAYFVDTRGYYRSIAFKFGAMRSMS